jgi:hypothetical protein
MIVKNATYPWFENMIQSLVFLTVMVFTQQIKEKNNILDKVQGMC